MPDDAINSKSWNLFLPLFLTYDNLPKNFESNVAFLTDIFLQKKGLAKSSSITAERAFRPDDTVLKGRNQSIYNRRYFT